MINLRSNKVQTSKESKTIVVNRFDYPEINFGQSEVIEVVGNEVKSFVFAKDMMVKNEVVERVYVSGLFRLVVRS